MAKTRQVVSSLLVALVAACGGESTNNFPVPVPGDDAGLAPRVIVDAPLSPDVGPADGSSGSDGSVGAGDAAADGQEDAALLTVTVDIKSPIADEFQRAHDPFAPWVDVTIDTLGGTGNETVTMVAATVTRVGGTTPSAAGTLNETRLERTPESTVVIHHFTDTPVNVSTLESGSYQLKIAVTTSSAVMAEAAVDFTIDAGPVIRIDAPVQNKFYRSSAPMDVTITDALFGPIKPANVTISVAQQDVPHGAPSGPDQSQYSATIDFSSYDPPLSGEQILTVRASNGKTESVVSRRFVADDTGPTITSTVPDVGALIGRVINISAQVTDQAGVSESSVVAVVAHGDMMFEIPLQLSMATPDTYQALFDTSRLPRSALFPSISFRASDKLDNKSSIGYLLSLDNTPPLVDLDPPLFTLIRKKVDTYECSWPFDPLGSTLGGPGGFVDAVSDLDTVPQLFEVRARIEDQGNDPLFGGADLIPIADIDDSRVQLLVLNDTSQALVVDTDKDGLCDAINPLLAPSTTPVADPPANPASATHALLINMVPITPSGTGDYFKSPMPPGGPCSATGTDESSPNPICDTTPMTVVIPSDHATPAIYTLPPVKADRLQCVGRQFDTLGNFIKDGWICLAVAVWDKLGNGQVSRPIRVCVDKDGSGTECGVGSPLPPDCTGTLIESKPVPKVDATKPCLPWRTYDGYANYRLAR
jgi:hypothetical protein